MPKGGSGQLSQALARCIAHYGGTILTGQSVTRLLRTGRRVTGIETAERQQYLAQDAVIGAIHPHHLRRYFPDIDEGVLRRAERVQLATYSSLVTHYALREPVRFRDSTGNAGGALLPGVDKFYLVGPFMHPGAGLTGAGRTTAMRILQDLEIDFGTVIEGERYAVGARDHR